MINAFANKNAKFNELKQTAAKRKKELQLLEDAGDELLMLDDETMPIPYPFPVSYFWKSVNGSAIYSVMLVSNTFE